jgi:tetratricopeptide (TPR) repeat protein
LIGLLARGLLPAALLLCLAGCSSQLLREAAAAQPQVEILRVPYYPQRAYQCGPAALASILAASGATASADSLAHEVYIAGRQGSLQAELLAATRRHARVAYLLEPTLPALLRELEQGHPVLVLQNFGLKSWPRWHYAVVIGYDRGHDTFLLRSGRHERQPLAARRFLATWRRAGSWAFIALPPGELPAEASATGFLDAAATLEALGDGKVATPAYEAAVKRWPQEPLAWFALANNRLALGLDAAAETAYREVLRLAPAQIPARNNLALLLARRGCLSAARATLEPARAAAAGGPFAAQIADSVREIEQRGAAGTRAGVDCGAQ